MILNHQIPTVANKVTEIYYISHRLSSFVFRPGVGLGRRVQKRKKTGRVLDSSVLSFLLPSRHQKVISSLFPDTALLHVTNWLEGSSCSPCRVANSPCSRSGCGRSASLSRLVSCQCHVSIVLETILDRAVRVCFHESLSRHYVCTYGQGSKEGRKKKRPQGTYGKTTAVSRDEEARSASCWLVGWLVGMKTRPRPRPRPQPRPTTHFNKAKQDLCACDEEGRLYFRWTTDGGRVDLPPVRQYQSILSVPLRSIN